MIIFVLDLLRLHRSRSYIKNILLVSILFKNRAIMEIFGRLLNLRQTKIQAKGPV